MGRMRLVGAVALCLVMFGCGSDDDSSQGADAPVAVTGEFVGKASAEDAYVAIFTSNAQADGQFDFVAYVCNRQVPLEGSTELAEWFTGTGRDSSVNLQSQAGTSRLQATLAGDRVTGTVELSSGTIITFEATRDTGGPAGLFEVGLDDQGNLTGTSRGGKTMKLSPFERDGEPGYSGLITSPDGSTVPYELFVRGGHITAQDLADMKSPRTIILFDGTSRGILDPIALRGRRSTASGT